MAEFWDVPEFWGARPTDISPEYLAGFIDGEGYLGIVRIKNGAPRPYRRSPSHPSKTYRRSAEHIIRVQVSNTNLDGLKAIQASFGGALTAMKTPNRARNKPAYKLTWHSRRAETILELVGPYLLLKRPQYRLLLEFMKFRQKNRRIGGSNGPLDPAVIELRDDFHRRLKRLNQRGITTLASHYYSAQRTSALDPHGRPRESESIPFGPSLSQGSGSNV